MKELFTFLCGILYLIGYPFGWSYEETSIYICVYLWPILCCFSTIPILVISILSIAKHKICGIILSVLSIVYNLYYVFYCNLIIERYSITNPNSFMKCMLDLKAISESLKISYEALNIYIYVVLFLFIIITNYIIYRIIKHFVYKK